MNLGPASINVQGYTFHQDASNLWKCENPPPGYRIVLYLDFGTGWQAVVTMPSGDQWRTHGTAQPTPTAAANPAVRICHVPKFVDVARPDESGARTADALELIAKASDKIYVTLNSLLTAYCNRKNP